MKFKCWLECGQDCSKNLYPLVGDSNPYSVCESTALADSQSTCDSRILIKLSPVPFERVTFKISFNQEEFLGTIGGHLGFWVGFSMFAILSFLINIPFKIARMVGNLVGYPLKLFRIK